MPLTRAELVRRFLTSSPRIELLRARLLAADAEIAAASRLDNPVIAYDREEVYTNGRGRPESSVRLSIPLDLSGRRGLEIDAAESARAAEERSVESARLLALTEALELYARAALARERAAILASQRNTVAKLVDAVAARARAGDASTYDARRMELELVAFDELLADAEIEDAALGRALARLLGDGTGRYSATDAPVPSESVPKLEELVQRAASGHPDLAAARLRVTEAEQLFSAASRRWIPRLEPSVGYKDVRSPGDDARGYTAGVALTLPIFDHGQAEGARAEARAQAARAELRDVEAHIIADVHTAHAALSRHAPLAAEYRARRLAEVDALLRQAELAYSAGERSLLELLEAERLARDTHLRAIALVATAAADELALWRAVGAPLDKEISQ